MPHIRPLLFLLCVLVPALFSGCTPLRKGSSAQEFYSTGIADINITVAKPLTLATAGNILTPVPSDLTISPNSKTTYAVYAEEGSGPVIRQAHILLAILPYPGWKWEMETWAGPETISYTKMRTAGKDWTVRILPVEGAQDWFSSFWTVNNREVPAFWLAKRWSSTPSGQTRLVAEYREAAPQCMRDRLSQDAARPQGSPSLKGKELWRNCQQEIEAFSHRADAVFLLGKSEENTPEASTGSLTLRPSALPDMEKLAGRADPTDDLRIDR